MEFGQARDAEGAQGAFDVEFAGLAFGGEGLIDGLWDDAFGEIEHFLEALTVADHDLAAHPELVQGAFFNFAGGDFRPAIDEGFAFDLAQEERAFLFDTREHAAHGFFQVRRIFTPMNFAFEFLHQGAGETVVAHGEVGGGVVPVFEDGAVGVVQLMEHVGVVIGDVGPEDVVVGALDDGDGVDLDVAEVFDGAEGGGFALAERCGAFGKALGAQGNQAGLSVGDMRH